LAFVPSYPGQLKQVHKKFKYEWGEFHPPPPSYEIYVL